MDPTAKPPFKQAYDAHSLYGRNVIEEHIRSKIAKQGPLKIPRSLQRPRAADSASPPIAILGAGVGGLYAAMMLQSLGLSYEILEASGRPGGRMYTYPFSTAPHDYFDVGAMRFPDINIMGRTFDLIKNRNLPVPLIPYIFENDNTFLSYNGSTVRRTVTDFFWFDQTGVPPNDLTKGYQSFVDQALDRFIPLLEDDLKAVPPVEYGPGWAALMQADKYSTRGYMTLNLNYTEPVIDWLETMDKSTGWYDQSFAETVLEAMCFAQGQQPQADPNAIWHCIDGGSSVLPNAMADYIMSQAPNALRYNSTVSAIQATTDSTGQVTMNVTVGTPGPNQTPTTNQYSQVISTIPLPVLRTLNIDEAGLNTEQMYALRQLQYGPAEKIGIKFKTQWWSQLTSDSGLPLNITGGQSFTDRCIRTVVYPSYGSTETTVLIASYAWTQDAIRMGGLFGTDPESQLRLKDLVIRDLAAVHGVDYQTLYDDVVQIYPWDWSQDPLTQGAYAFFGPGQFTRLYRSLTHPAAKGHLHIAGEAISVRHAWVAGALDSSWRAVKSLLHVSYPNLVPQFETIWGKSEEWITSTTFRDEVLDGKETDLLLAHIAAHIKQEDA